MSKQKNTTHLDQETEHKEALPETGIAAFAITNPYFTIVAAIMTTILGVVSLFLLPNDLLPSANMPAVQILTFYSGMPVEHVEEDLSYLFERYTGQAVGIQSQESRSLMGVSIVKNYFYSTTTLSNAIAQNAALVMSILRKLPPGTQPPLILPFDPMASIPLALCAVSGDFSEAKLQDTARYYVADAIQMVEGAMAPTVMGGSLRQIIVYLNSQKLKNYNMSLTEVMNVLNKMNTFIPPGDIKIGNWDYQILSNGIVDYVKQMNEFPIRAKNGVVVQIKDVGHAEDSHQIQTNVVEVDGKRQVYVPIYRQPGANSIKVVDRVKKSVKEVEKTLNGYKLTIVGDQSIFIRKAIESIAHEAIIGGGLAALMVLLFLGSPIATIGVLLSIPLSIVVAFICMKALGQSINVMTLGGLALSIGVLVDNAIVVIEVIMQKIQKGLGPKEASLIGATEVAMPVLASTVSTLIVFLPVLFIAGIVQILFSALSIAVISAMIGSYLAAMMVIPLFTSKYLKPQKGKLTGFIGWVQDKVDRVIESYGRSLSWTLKSRKIIVPSTIVFLVIGFFVCAPRIGTELFPKADAGNFRIDMRTRTGTRIENTTKMAEAVEKKLRQWILPKDLEMIIMNAGIIYGYPAAYTPNAGTYDYYFDVMLTETREHTSQYYAAMIRQKLKEEFPTEEFGFELGGLLSSALNGGLRSPIDVQVIGPKIEESYKVASELKNSIQNLRGAVDVRIQQRFDSPAIFMDVKRVKASELGLTPDDVVKNVVSAVSNSASYLPAIWINPRTGIDYFFGVQFDEDKIVTKEELDGIPITTPIQDRSVRLRDIASNKEIQVQSEINHVNLERVINIFADAQGRDIGGLSRDIIGLTKKIKIPDGYKIAIRGEIKQMNDAIGSLGGGFLLAAILVYLILVVQFKSFKLPGIIMTTVPMGMVGVVMMLAATDTYFSIQAAIGAIFVIGVAVSHGVLLIEYILQCVEKGGSFHERILEGAKARLRPITMTTLASVLGLVPMAIGMGRGSEANIPLGRAVIGGQILATLLNFYIVPCLFTMYYGKEFAQSHGEGKAHA